MPTRHTPNRVRRPLAVALYLGSISAGWLVVYPLVADGTPTVPGPAATVLDSDDPLFTPITLPAGRWRIVEPAGVPGAGWTRFAREAVGTASADEFDLAAVLPQGVCAKAVRVNADDVPTAVLTEPTDLAAALAGWKAIGWGIVARDQHVYRLARGSRSAVVWALPRGGATQLLIALTGGNDR